MSHQSSLSNPLVTVIIATYRRKESLKRAIESILLQSYKEIEIIVVDDNANEEWNREVEQILLNFKNKKEIVYIQNKTNQGSAKTRNVGIKAAKGEYVTFLDDDDLYLPNKIKKQVDGMIRNNADYSISDLTLFNDKGDLVEYRKRSYLSNAKNKDLLKFHLMYHMTGTDTMMFTKQYLIDIGGFDPIDIGDEFYLINKAISRKGKLYYLPESNIKAFVHKGEGGLSSGNQKIKGENRLFQYKKQYFNKLDSKAKRYIRMRHYAVLAFAYFRNKKIVLFLISGLESFFCAPIQCIGLIRNLK